MKAAGGGGVIGPVALHKGLPLKVGPASYFLDTINPRMPDRSSKNILGRGQESILVKLSN